MINTTCKISKSRDAMKAIGEKLKALKGAEVLVGITQEKSSRHGEQITNAELMYVHTNGSPIRGIPARPVIEPAIAASGNKEHIVEEMKLAGQAALQGDAGAMEGHMERAGQEGENASRDWFTDSRNGWAPNSPMTVMRKLGKLAGARRKAAMAAYMSGASTYQWKGAEYGIDTPLIDTGELRKSITHVLRRK